jgi:hypothetical protein
MTKPFSVEQMLLCEYATQDVQGKFIVAGITGGAIVFSDRPNTWPAYKIFVEIRPLTKSIRANIVFYKKGGDVVTAGNYLYENKMDKPNSIERNFLNIQIPPTKYEGDGVYILDIRDGKKTVMSKEFQVVSVPMQMPDLGEVNFEVTEPKFGVSGRINRIP